MSNKDKFGVVVAWVSATAQVLAVIIMAATALWLIAFLTN